MNLGEGRVRERILQRFGRLEDLQALGGNGWVIGRGIGLYSRQWPRQPPVP